MGLGRRFFINKEGHFITNYLVLAPASSAAVRTADGIRLVIRKTPAEASNIFGDGFNIFYDPSVAGKYYLRGQTYSL